MRNVRRPVIGRGEAASSQSDVGDRHVPAWELALLLVASLNYWTDLLRLTFPGADGASLAFRGIHFAFYGVFIVLLLSRMDALFLLLRRTPLLLIFLVLPAASALWSVNPEETFTRAVALIGSSLFGLYAGTRLTPLLALRLLAWTATLSAVISLVLIFLFPSVGLMSEGEYVNVWSGAFVHKNGLGQMAALGAIIAVIVLQADGIKNNRSIMIGLALNLFLLAGARSLTSQLVFCASIIVVLTIARCLTFLVRHVGPVVVAAGVVLLACIASITVDDIVTVLASLGKDASMSSRLPLWEILIDFGDQNYWLGWGYEAFFTDANFAIRLIEAKLHFKPYYAHNGYIELWLGLGAVGCLIMALLFLQFATVASLQLYRDGRDPLFMMCFVYLPIFLMQNVAECTILQRNSMSWSLFVLLYVSLFASTRHRVEPSHARAKVQGVDLASRASRSLRGVISSHRTS